MTGHAFELNLHQMAQLENYILRTKVADLMPAVEIIKQDPSMQISDVRTACLLLPMRL